MVALLKYGARHYYRDGRDDTNVQGKTLVLCLQAVSNMKAGFRVSDKIRLQRLQKSEKYYYGRDGALLREE